MLNQDFLNRMKEYLGDGYADFIQSYNGENIRGLRVNSNYLNDEKFALLCDFSADKIMNISNAYIVKEEMKFGFHPLHHAGAFYLQDPSAMIPALSYKFDNSFKVLDLCAAPGGKSTQLASMLSNGVLFANEIDNKRAWSLYSNVERLGFKNVIVTNNRPEDYLKNFQGYFDLILVDAPCSGEGMFRKYPESQDEWSLNNVYTCASRDKEILDVTNKLLKDKGILIYSTCTFAKEENEEMVNYLVDNYNYETIPLNEELLPYVSNGFINNTYRIYPQNGFGEGQFVAVLKKHQETINKSKLIKSNNLPIEFKDFCKKNLTDTISNVYQKNDDLYYLALNVDLSNLKVLNYGVKLGKIQNKRFIPDHNMFKAFSNLFINKVNLDFKDELVTKYLHGEQISYDVANGFGVIFVNDIPLGGFKASNGNLNNYYPKGLRNF